jgi:DNA-binding transcriptional ArsR family regulator
MILAVDRLHDAVNEVDTVFRALSDGSRRRLLDSLNERNGQSLKELCADLEMTRQSVSKHLAILEAANLVTTVWRGREKLHYLNPEPINAVADRWISRYHRERVQALAGLKAALEQETMSRTEFVYTTYIRTTPERLWQALIDPAFTNQYWGVSFTSDWQAGSPIIWVQKGVTISDPGQVVLVAEPFERLSYTFHTFTPEFGVSVGIDDALRQKLASERRTKVTFELVSMGEIVRLTVTHDDFDPNSVLLGMISEGWPAIIASLKSLLETGEALPG